MHRCKRHARDAPFVKSCSMWTLDWHVWIYVRPTLVNSCFSVFYNYAIWWWLFFHSPFSALTLSIGWQRGHTAHEDRVTPVPKAPFWNKWRKKNVREPASSGLHGTSVKKWRWWLFISDRASSWTANGRHFDKHRVKQCQYGYGASQLRCFAISRRSQQPGHDTQLAAAVWGSHRDWVGGCPVCQFHRDDIQLAAGSISTSTL